MTTRRASDRDPDLDRPATDAPATAGTTDPLAGRRASDVIRVRDPRTGDHYTTTVALARKAGATLLPDHDAVDRYGTWLPRKTNISRKES